MALRWIEGFEAVGVTLGAAATGLTQKYKVVTVPNNALVRAGRLNNYCIEPDNASFDMLTPDLADMGTVIVGMAYRTVATYTNHRLIEIVHPDNSVGINLRLKSDGQFEIYLNTTLLATSVSSAIPLASWGYLELKVVIHNSAGSYDFKVNGVSKLSASGIDTQSGSDAFARNVRFTPTGGGGIGGIDDIYVCDNGGSVNNDFLGNVKVEALFPNAEGDSEDFTPSSGTNNSLLVDENPPNDDTDYVQAAAALAQDLYQYTDPTVVSIFGVQMNTRVKETDATTYSMISVCKSGGNVSDGPTDVIGSASYIMKSRVVELDPATTALWSLSGLSAAQFGMRVG